MKTRHAKKQHGRGRLLTAVIATLLIAAPASAKIVKGTKLAPSGKILKGYYVTCTDPRTERSYGTEFFEGTMSDIINKARYKCGDKNYSFNPNGTDLKAGTANATALTRLKNSVVARTGTRSLDRVLSV